jgi:uncharacterized membrane protein YczE
VRGGLAIRIASLVWGLFLFAWGIVLILESHLGLSPWDVLHQGIANHTPISFGAANTVVGVVVLGLAWALGSRPGWGTLANALLVGGFIQLYLSFDAVTALQHGPLAVRVLLLASGIAVIGPATAFYIGADLGAGPRDTLMLAATARTGWRVGLVRAAIEVLALLTGIALGGTFGIGTVAFALLIGPVVELSFTALARSPVAVAEPGAPAVLIGE